MGVTLSDAKQHLRIEHGDDDVLLGLYLAAAEGHLADAGVDMDVDPLPPAIIAAVLLMIGHFYENREATAATAVIPTSLGVNRLIAPHREHVA